MMSISNHLAQATFQRLVTWLLISCLCMSSAASNDGDILHEMLLARKDYKMLPNVQMLIDLASNSTSPPHGTLQLGACARVINLPDSVENIFLITKETNFCSAFFKTTSRSSKLTFEVSVPNLYSCNEEYLYINDGATLDSTLCGGNTSISSRSSRFLFVQYRQQTRTGTAFNFTVKAVPNVVPTTEMAKMNTVMEKSFSEGRICSGCGYVNRNVRQSRILGGSTARVTEHPWMVGLHVVRKKNLNDRVAIVAFCGASILDRRHVLTAAHCVQAESTHEHPLVIEIFVVVGSDLGFQAQKSDANSQTIKVAHWYTHPSYSPDIEEGKSYDIAVLKLEKEIQFNNRVGPVCLAAPLEFTHTDVTVTGYGHDPEEGKSSRTLQSVKLTIRPANECIEFYKRAHPNFDLKSHQVCLYSPSKDACGGDSGGPAIVKWENRFYQVGVVSFGAACKNEDAKIRYGGYTRVSSFIPWIKTVFQGSITC